MNPATLARVVTNFAKKISVQRSLPGAHDEHGRWQEQAKEELSIDAVVQPARGQELQRLPEGRRTSETIKVYTTTKLLSAEVDTQNQPDVLVWQGREYQVETIDPWDEYGNYFKALALKVGT